MSDTGDATPGPQVLPANHWLFHLANVFLLLSYISPNVLTLRLALGLGTVCFALWGGVVLNVSVDTVVWNGVFAIINFTHAAILLYRMRPIKLPPDLQTVYENIFPPSRFPLSKHDFLLLAKGSFTRTLQKGSYYARAGDHCYNLAILLEGEMEVLKKDPRTGKKRLLHLDTPVVFVDSPEWVQRKSDPDGESLFRVYIRAKTNCKYMMWPREVLDKLLNANPHLAAALNAALNYDLAQKLIIKTDQYGKTDDGSVSYRMGHQQTIERADSTAFNVESMVNDNTEENASQITNSKPEKSKKKSRQNIESPRDHVTVHFDENNVN